jgi:PDZ domain-containing protein
VLGVGIAVLIGLAAIIPSSWVAEEQNPRTEALEPIPFARIPSLAQPVADRVRFGDLEDSVERYASDANLYFVTVGAPRQSLLSWIIGRDDPAVEFISFEQLYGSQTPQQRRVLSLESMRTSGQVAQFVALEALGFDVELTPGAVLVQQLLCLEVNADGTECVRESPAAEVLEPGDRLIEIDGAPIDTITDLAARLRGRTSGEVVELTVERAGRELMTFEIELIAASDDPNRALIGFIPVDTRRVVLPFELEIDTGSIGGPSAGLVFTLTLIDELTPGSLTGGVAVAATGTIELDGSVGPVGGLPQKASAAAQNGVRVFLVPAAQSEAEIEAARRAGGPGLEVIPVGSLADALEVLESLGGDPVVIASG